MPAASLTTAVWCASRRQQHLLKQ